jgi:Family of unknown function (DUF6496)
MGKKKSNQNEWSFFLPFVWAFIVTMASTSKVQNPPLFHFGMIFVVNITSKGGEYIMPRKYSKAAQKTVESAMHREKKGTLKSGRSGKIVMDPKQAIAIGISEARKKGERVPKKQSD